MPEQMKIIGAGFGRTGTISLKAALERIGFGPCYHMIETFNRPDHTAMWLQAAQGIDFDWRRIFSGFRATVDWPACAFYDQLIQAFPHAKVLLTVREPDAWYESVRESIGKRPSAQLQQPVHDLQARMVRSIVWERSLHGQLHDRDAAIEIFNNHILTVRRSVPASRLLVLDVAEGWQPLCDFLEVETPGEPFPHLNDRDTYNDRSSFANLTAQNTHPSHMHSP